MCIFWFDGRVGSLGGKGAGRPGRKEGIPIQSANHSDKPPRAIIVSAMASTMI